MCAFRGTRFNVSLAFLLVAVAFTASGCIDQASVTDLANSSSQVASALAKIYDLLYQEKHDAQTIWATAGALQFGDVRDEDQDYTLIYTQLNQRAQMARALAGVYDALNRTSSSKIGENLSTAGEGLAAAVNGLKVMKAITAGIADVSPVSILQGLADAAARWKADQDLQQALRDAAPAAGKVALFYRKEQGVYAQFAQDRDTALTNFAVPLVKRGLVEPSAILHLLTDIYGVPLSQTACPKTASGGPEPHCADAAAQLLILRADQVRFVSQRAVVSMGQTLDALAALYDPATSGRSAAQGLLIQRLAETNAYLKQVADLRAAPTTSQ